MCFKKFWAWFMGDDGYIPVPPPTGEKKIALLFAINNYPGAHDLNGCINDIDDVEKKLKAEFPDFAIMKFRDAQVTVENMFCTIKDTLLSMNEGVLYWHYSGHGTQIPSNSEANGYHEALYLYNGPFLDDQVQELQAMTAPAVHVVAKFDSCFSGDMLRYSRTTYRFYPMPGIKVRHKTVKKFAKSNMTNWVVISGCGEEQTSADAFINNRYNGAFTYFDNLSYSSTSTYMDEMRKLHLYLPGQGYDQNPTIDGDTTLFSSKVLT